MEVMPQHHDLVCMSVNPVMPKMMLPDVTDVVMPRNPTSATLPHTNQPDPASQPYDSMDVSKMVRDSATVDNFQAFPAIWIRVETKSRRTADITPHSSVRGRGLLNSIVYGTVCAICYGTIIMFQQPSVVEGHAVQMGLSRQLLFFYIATCNGMWRGDLHELWDLRSMSVVHRGHPRIRDSGAASAATSRLWK